jgi:hypothetical protein
MEVFVGFSRISLLGILIFKGLTARLIYKSFGFKGLIHNSCVMCLIKRGPEIVCGWANLLYSLKY